jgi:phosphomannomutase
LVLIIKNILAREAGDIVINISSSKMSEDVAKEFGRKTFKSKVGEANVLQKMLEVGAVVGGEGGGGGIYPKINTARDGLVCLALILELMARENKKIGEIVAGLPKYCMLKDKVPVTDKVDSLYEKLKKQFPEAETDEIDGVRFDWPDETWVIVRASITEPIIRIVGEAREKNRIATLFDEIKLTLSEK